jgi:adenylate cyclase
MYSAFAYNEIKTGQEMMGVPSVIIKILRKIKVELLKGLRLPVFLGLMGTVLTIILYVSNQPVISNTLARMDNMFYDQRFEFMLEPPPNSEHSIVIIDVDQKSLAQIGQWPWSRRLLGQLVEQLTNHGALVVGWDFLFPEHERNATGQLRQAIEAGSAGEFADLLPRLTDLQTVLDGDRAFAESMAFTYVVLGFSFKPNEVLEYGTLPEPIISIDEELANSLAIANMQGYEGNVDILQTAARGGGFIDNLPDIDGII